MATYFSAVMASIPSPANHVEPERRQYYTGLANAFGYAPLQEDDVHFRDIGIELRSTRPSTDQLLRAGEIIGVHWGYHRDA